MIIEFVSKNYDASEKLKDIITKKVDRLDNFFESDTSIKVMLKASKEIYTLELTIIVDGGVLRAEVSSDNMYANIDTALPKLEKQIIKHHKKLASKNLKFREKVLSEIETPASEKQSVVVRSKTYSLSPMTVEDAIEELELVGHSFFVFLNKANNNINILYRRNDDDYGLIETEIM
jgi:putative sigma-54 modulation protein